MIDKLSTDSRTLKPGELFVALHGENFDGHNFVQAAAKTSAAGAPLPEATVRRAPKTLPRQCWDAVFESRKQREISITTLGCPELS